MTSIDRATQVMKLVVAQEATRGRAASCQKLAEALAEAGLLIPSLPHSSAAANHAEEES